VENQPISPEEEKGEEGGRKREELREEKMNGRTKFLYESREKTFHRSVLIKIVNSRDCDLEDVISRPVVTEII